MCLNSSGFDVVIGNPPYILVFNEEQKKYFENNYPEFKTNNDLYVAFICKDIMLLNVNGMFSLITPNTYIKGSYFEKLRKLFVQYQINEIIDFGVKSIFKDANVFTAIFNITNNEISKDWKLKSDLNIEKGTVFANSTSFYIQNKLIRKLEKHPKLSEYFLVRDSGYNYATKGRGKKRGGSVGSKVLYPGKQLDKRDIPYLKGSNIKRYIISNPANYLKYDYNTFLKKNDIFRFTASILETKPKIIYRQTSNKLIGAIELNGYHNDRTVHVIIEDKANDFNLKYVIAIFNSKLLNYYYQYITEETGRTFAQVKIANVKKLPFVKIDKEKQIPFVNLVNQMLDIQKELRAAEAVDLKPLHQKSAALDHQIDALTYKLYGLTEKEIKIVEGKNNGK